MSKTKEEFVRDAIIEAETKWGLYVERVAINNMQTIARDCGILPKSYALYSSAAILGKKQEPLRRLLREFCLID